MKKLEGLLLAILGGFAVTFLFLSREYNSTAALFPRLIAVASLLFLVLSRVSGTSGPAAPAVAPEAPDTGFSLRPPILALQAGYVVFIYLLGFFTATLLYLIAAPIQLRYERRAGVIVTGVGLNPLLSVFFLA